MAFGVRLGEPSSNIRAALVRAGFTYVGDIGCDYGLSRLIDCRLVVSDTTEIYSLKHFLRHGNLYVRYSHGGAVQMVWDFYLLPYIDL